MKSTKENSTVKKEKRKAAKKDKSPKKVESKKVKKGKSIESKSQPPLKNSESKSENSVDNHPKTHLRDVQDKLQTFHNGMEDVIITSGDKLLEELSSSVPPGFMNWNSPMSSTWSSGDLSSHLNSTSENNLSSRMNYFHSNGEDKSHKLLPIIKINLFQKAMGHQSRQIGSSLSKPSFCPGDPYSFAVGTEEQDGNKKHLNRLIFASFEEQNVKIRSMYSLPDHVRDIQWMDSSCLIVAVNQKLALVKLNSQLTSVEDMVMFPEFHKETIREIAVSISDQHLVISGGFDGNVFVTDVTRLCVDIQKNEKKSENSLYPCRDVVGSVSWHIEDPYLASCTTDTGILHIFDIRTDKRRAATVHDTGKKELYTHGYQDRNTILLGFGDGSFHAFDIRTKKTVRSFQDPVQRVIGDIKFDHFLKNFALFGSPQFSVYGFDSPQMNCYQYSISDIPISPLDYKTCGEWNKEIHNLAVTDSFGTIALFTPNTGYYSRFSS